MQTHVCVSLQYKRLCVGECVCESVSRLRRLLEGGTRLMSACIWYTGRLTLRDLDKTATKGHQEEGEEGGSGGGAVDHHDITFMC